jgi:hypothetical protein
MEPSKEGSHKRKLGNRAKMLQPNPDVPEYDTASQEIEADLNQYRIGHFKVFYKNMNFNWNIEKKGDRANREVNRERLGPLYQSMNKALFRTDLRHRMSGVIALANLKDRITDPRTGEPIKLSQVKDLNLEAIFPVLTELPIQIEMQSGQHRMTVLVTLKEDPSQHWWIVTLYDTGLISKLI